LFGDLKLANLLKSIGRLKKEHFANISSDKEVNV